MIRKPATFVAGRKVLLQDGVTYQPGEAVPGSVAKATRHLSALISRGILKPNARMNRTKGKVETPQASHIGPSMRQTL